MEEGASLTLRDRSYSTTYCHHVPGKGSNERSMLLARVRQQDLGMPMEWMTEQVVGQIVVGRYTQGHISYRVPPVDPSGESRPDSVTRAEELTRVKQAALGSTSIAWSTIRGTPASSSSR
eukprot:756155-Hanusia_phi.AAC.5